MKRVPPVDVRTLRERLCAVLYKAPVHGAARRAMLVPLLKEWQAEVNPDGLRVNARGHIIVDKDADIRYFLAHSIGELQRVQKTRRTSCTYFRLI